MYITCVGAEAPGAKIDCPTLDVTGPPFLNLIVGILFPDNLTADKNTILLNFSIWFSSILFLGRQLLVISLFNVYLIEIFY